MHFVTTTLNNKSFLTIDRMPWHGAVRKPGPPQFVHDSYDFDWFDDGEAEQVRRDDYTVAWRHRICGVHDKPTRGFYLPKKHLANDPLPNRIATPNEGRQL
jgi:hypothetical protein